MSYDLMVFEPSAPPGDRNGFLAWYTDIARWSERLVLNPAATTPALQGWYRDMIKRFPAVSGPDGDEIATIDNDNRVEYRFAPNAVLASFQWEASRHANRQAIKLARAHCVGFFEVSGDNAGVWAPSEKGVYRLMHRSHERA